MCGVKSLIEYFESFGVLGLNVFFVHVLGIDDVEIDCIVWMGMVVIMCLVMVVKGGCGVGV